MAVDYHALPRLDDSLSFIYLERCRVEQDAEAIAAWDLEGITEIPIAALNCLLLGPGTVITHAAAAALAENGCNVVWVGEHGARAYACATGETRSARNLLRQATLATRETTRLRVVARMYRLRFPEKLSEGLTLQQIRGKEGARVRDAYADAAKRFEVDWDGRSYDRGNWEKATPVNRAVSAANACLYGLCHAAIVALGYSPGLGFVHSGKQLSFVYDIADLYKTEVSIPAAFEAVREERDSMAMSLGPKDRVEIESLVRTKMRHRFLETRLLERLPKDIAHVLNVPVDEAVPDDPWADDPSAPAKLWEPSGEGDKAKLPDDE